jgi:hypothetical protein
MSFTQIHPEEKQLIEHKFTSEEEDALSSNHFTHFLK